MFLLAEMSAFASLFQKRLTILFLGILTAFWALLVRLFYLQVIDQSKYALLSDKNRIYTVYSAAPRGTIFDRKGRVLASSRKEYQVALDLKQYRNRPESWVLLCEKLELDPTIPLKAYVQKNLKSRGLSAVVPLKGPLTWEDILMAERLSVHIPGLVVTPKLLRVYPYKEAFCHVVGYVTSPSQDDIARNANLAVFNATVGRTGLERAFENHLQGSLGVKQLEINATRHVVRILEEEKPAPGKNLHLTLDAELQVEVKRLLRSVRCGAAVVIDVRTGAILAAVSCPGFNTNLFAESLTGAQWQELSEHPDRPLIDRITQGLYAPGSTFKMMVALAALDAHIITPETRFTCPGFFQVGNGKFHCWKWRNGGHGSVNLVQALEQSCDVYFYNVATKLGVGPLVKTAGEFSFGEKTGIEWANERKGSLPSLPYLWEKKSGLLGTVINLSIGQGNLTATPLQLAVMTARIATGQKVTPHIVLETEKPSFPRLPYSEDVFKIIRKGMEKVVWGKHGTALRAQSAELRIAGKTGSSQVCRIKKEERQKGKIIERPYALKDHALFVGYAPVDQPRFAVALVVEHGESGGRVASPLGKEILLATERIMGK